MEKHEKTTAGVVDSDRPKDKKIDWDSNSCPFFIFGDDDAAEYDLAAIKKFFNRFKKKKEK